jgi:CheY-like chemotaxis protein
MLVDDDIDMVNLVSRYLQSVGVRVVAASSGRECLRLVSDIEVDLILVDLAMPEMDGFATCRCLKEDPAGTGIPVVMLSARDDDETRLQAKRFGAVDFLGKPVFRIQLLRTVQKHLKVPFALAGASSPPSQSDPAIRERTAASNARV